MLSGVPCKAPRERSVPAGRQTLNPNLAETGDCAQRRGAILLPHRIRNGVSEVDGLCLLLLVGHFCDQSLHARIHIQRALHPALRRSCCNER